MIEKNGASQPESKIESVVFSGVQRSILSTLKTKEHIQHTTINNMISHTYRPLLFSPPKSSMVIAKLVWHFPHLTYVSGKFISVDAWTTVSASVLLLLALVVLLLVLLVLLLLEIESTESEAVSPLTSEYRSVGDRRNDLEVGITKAVLLVVIVAAKTKQKHDTRNVNFCC